MASSIVLFRALLLSMSLALFISSSRGTEVNVCNNSVSPCEQGACNDYCSKQFVYGLCHHNENNNNAIECCCATGLNDPPEKVPTKLCKQQTFPCDQRVCNDHCQSQLFSGSCVDQNGKTSCCCLLSD